MKEYELLEIEIIEFECGDIVTNESEPVGDPQQAGSTGGT